MSLAVGDIVEHDFTIDAEAMSAFARLSNDHSAIHVDDAFAQSRGFRERIVYGGLMLAQLSHVLGARLPGDRGLSGQWTINYRQPLYVGEPARLSLTVTHVSTATGMITANYSIRTSERVVATGKTQSFLPLEDFVGENFGEEPR